MTGLAPSGRGATLLGGFVTRRPENLYDVALTAVGVTTIQLAPGTVIDQRFKPIG
jgi:hypothetical protein